MLCTAVEAVCYRPCQLALYSPFLESQGKVGREDIAELCCALLSEPSAANCTFEVKSTVPFSQPWQVGLGAVWVGLGWVWRQPWQAGLDG
jgi:hypothetical protein